MVRPGAPRVYDEPMASVKKRLKGIQATLSRFAGDEKRIVDLIVGLTTERMERLLDRRLQGLESRLREQIVRDMEGRVPGQKEIDEAVERSVLRALEKRDA